MAKKPGLDVKGAQGGLSELKSRLLFVLGAIIVFRAGSYVPIPGIDAAVLAELFQQQKGTIIELFNMFSGGALSRASIFLLQLSQGRMNHRQQLDDDRCRNVRHDPQS